MLFAGSPPKVSDAHAGRPNRDSKEVKNEVLVQFARWHFYWKVFVDVFHAYAVVSVWLWNVVFFFVMIRFTRQTMERTGIIII